MVEYCLSAAAGNAKSWFFSLYEAYECFLCQVTRLYVFEGRWAWCTVIHIHYVCSEVHKWWVCECSWVTEADSVFWSIPIFVWCSNVTHPSRVTPGLTAVLLYVMEMFFVVNKGSMNYSLNRGVIRISIDLEVATLNLFLIRHCSTV